jgi:predicted dehydrogenase
MITIGVIGYGYWGPNLARNIAQHPHAALHVVCDRDPARLAICRQTYPQVQTTTDYHAVLADPALDAVAIATPVPTHAPLAAAALRAGKHVLVEKPMTDSRDAAQRLIDLATQQHRVLLVDHTYVYSGAVQKLAALVTDGSLGDVLYIDSVRANFGLVHRDTDVIWDLAVHDFSILDAVLPQHPVSVIATGAAHYPQLPAHTAFITLQYDGGCVAHLHVNWLFPTKVRKLTLAGTQQMAVFDDLDPVHKLRRFERTIAPDAAPDAAHVTHIAGATHPVTVDTTEPLYAEIDHFIACITQGHTPRTDGAAGLRVITLLEAATQSLAAQGLRITL